VSCVTSVFEYTFTTAGAVVFTTGAKESCIWPCDLGTTVSARAAAPSKLTHMKTKAINKRISAPNFPDALYQVAGFGDMMAVTRL
jgi:hypothetical protein